MFLESEITLQFQKRLRSISAYLALGTCIIGVLVLFGWQFNIEFIKRIVPGLVAMNPVTAICFIFTGTALMLIHKYEDIQHPFSLRKIFSLLTILTGLSCLLTNLLGIKGGIDQFFFTEKLNDEISNIHNRMAPNTAFNFMIAGLSLFLFDPGKESRHKISQYLILIPALISLLSIIGYIYGVRSFYGVLTYIPMAINTSFCFLVLTGSVLLASADKGFMADFTNNYVGSVLARKLIPPIIVVPVLLGFVIIYGERAGLYVPHFGTALFTAANILIFVYLVKKIQVSVNRADKARTAAEKKLVELNTELEKKTASLEMLNKEMETFSYSVSHDLKAPLRVIGGFTKLLATDLNDKLNEDNRELMDGIVKNTDKMRQLIEDLLEFSRVGRKELQSSHCDMEGLVKSVLKDQYLALKKKEYEIKISELYSCSGDPKMIEQVWVNLISNALKYSEKKEKPVVEISSFKENGETIYFVKDNGAGFNMDYSNKLFSVFQRLHSETEFEGTGIGLAIVNKIVSRHGGKVWADAKMNQGASFYFSLPAIEKQSS